MEQKRVVLGLSTIQTMNKEIEELKVAVADLQDVHFGELRTLREEKEALAELEAKNATKKKAKAEKKAKADAKDKDTGDGKE